eukprot:CFRG5958T1
MKRWRAVKKLRQQVRQVCGQPALLAYERWCARASLLSVNSDVRQEALLPNLDPDNGLQKDLVRLGGLTQEAAAKGVEQCCAASARLVAKMTSDEDITNDNDSMGKKTAEGHEDVKTVRASVVERGPLLAYSLQREKKPFFTLSKPHAGKLRALYTRARGGKWVKDHGDDYQNFIDAVFCVLSRYDALGGAGYQAALGEKAFDVLKTRMGCKCECFASPLNCRWGQYCSAFANIDKPFGSLGSFFDFYPTFGSFEMNPPFVPEVLCAAAEHAEDLLNRTETNSMSKADLQTSTFNSDRYGTLSFVIVVPAWKEVRMWSVLTQSKFLRGDPLIIPARNHGYCDGSQHNRRPSERYRVSSYDTAVFFLQTDAGAVKWPATPEVRTDLVAAMTEIVGSAKDVSELEDRYRKQGDSHEQLRKTVVSVHKRKGMEDGLKTMKCKKPKML